VHHTKSNHVPDSEVNNLSMTIWRIWVAKTVHTGGASGSKQPILEVLIDSSGDTRAGVSFNRAWLGSSAPKPFRLPWRHRPFLCLSRRRVIFGAKIGDGFSTS
jgi:hypothetical protein